VLVALNTHGTEPRGAEVTVDALLHSPGSTLRLLYPEGGTVQVRATGGRSSVRIDLPPAGMAILANLSWRARGGLSGMFSSETNVTRKALTMANPSKRRASRESNRSTSADRAH
jgi:hypothetical protein